MLYFLDYFSGHTSTFFGFRNTSLLMLPKPEVWREIGMSESVIEDSLLIAQILILLFRRLRLILLADHLLLLVYLGF